LWFHWNVSLPQNALPFHISTWTPCSNCHNHHANTLIFLPQFHVVVPLTPPHLSYRLLSFY